MNFIDKWNITNPGGSQSRQDRSATPRTLDDSAIALGNDPSPCNVGIARVSHISMRPGGTWRRHLGRFNHCTKRWSNSNFLPRSTCERGKLVSVGNNKSQPSGDRSYSRVHQLGLCESVGGLSECNLRCSWENGWCSREHRQLGFGRVESKLVYKKERLDNKSQLFPKSCMQ